jgi:hypothetical protein
MPATGFPTYPAAWQAGYMNRAYQFAAWCWVAIFLLIGLPLVLLLAIPALTLLFDSSGNPLQAAGANFNWFVNGFLGWVRVWYGLLLLALTGFAVFKLYGRYTLPKPFRPKIRVIRTTIRVVFLVTTVLSVGTFLIYFSDQAGQLYSDPKTQAVIEIIRRLLGL